MPSRISQIGCIVNQPIVECSQTCTDSGPNGPASPSHLHGQTDLLLVLVRVQTKSPMALSPSHPHGQTDLLLVLVRVQNEVPDGT